MREAERKTCAVVVIDISRGSAVVVMQVLIMSSGGSSRLNEHSCESAGDGNGGGGRGREGGIVTVVIRDVMPAPWGGMPSLENFAKDFLIVFGALEALMLIIDYSILSVAFF